MSHSSADKEVIMKIIADFEQEGITYWIDHEQINYGDSITESIEMGIRRSKYILACLSPNYVKSGWCRVEYVPIINRAYHLSASGILPADRENKYEKVIPVFLEPIDDPYNIPLYVFDTKHAKYHDKEDYEKFKIFLKGLRKPPSSNEYLSKAITDPQPHDIHSIFLDDEDLTEEEEKEVKKLKKHIQSLTTSDEYEFDVFLAHNSKDKPAIRKIYEYLKSKNLRPWLDEEEIAPGRSFQEIIQAAIPKSHSVAVFIGEHDLGNWQSLELKVFISQCVEKDIPVIHVLLPETSFEQFPERLLFLQEFHGVDFKSIDDQDALDNLEWGITGKKPNS
ncbi:toll/interleukin-1 receptor domain-containing protein [Anaerolineales bacterium HSG25]|nr:toll/interleukin-1 receptor domain-containing protein [Anaerolineales bacterium HSG25]